MIARQNKILYFSNLDQIRQQTIIKFITNVSLRKLTILDYDKETFYSNK